MNLASYWAHRLLAQRALLISLLIYTGLCVALFLSVGGDIASLTSDLDFYLSAVVRALPDQVSGLAQGIYESSPYVDPSYRLGWYPTPFYSYVFLAPLWLGGSQLGLACLGWLIGVLTLIGVFVIVRRHLQGLPRGFELLFMLMLPFNFNFLVDSLPVSTMSVAAMLIVLAFAAPMRWLRVVLLVCAAMTRSNFVVALACLFLVLLLFRPRDWRALLLDLVPAVTVSAVFYRLFYSSYPGSGLNYLLSAVYQGIDYAQPMGVELARGVLGINDEQELFQADLGVGDLWRLMLKPQSWSYVFNLWMLKVSIALGFVHEKLFLSEHGLWLTKAWRTGFFVFVSLPGSYAAALLMCLRRIPLLERCIYAWVLCYLLLNSLLIGDPRYLMGGYCFLAFALLRLISLLRPTPSKTL